MAQIAINGATYTLSDKLRVAYKLQECHNHKPYTEIFKSLGSMPLEKQIEFIWISFTLANPDAPSVVKEGEKMTQIEFLNYCLDNIGLTIIMDLIQGIMDGIMYGGLSEEEKEKKRQERDQDKKETPEK